MNTQICEERWKVEVQKVAKVLALKKNNNKNNNIMKILYNNGLNRRPAISVARAMGEGALNEMWLSKQTYYVYMIQLLSLYSTHKDTTQPTELNKGISSHSYYKKRNSTYTPAAAHPQ